MNKLFTKIAALFLGMTMAVGVGVAVASSGKAAEQVNAVTGNWSWSGTAAPSGFTTGSNKSNTLAGLVWTTSVDYSNSANSAWALSTNNGKTTASFTTSNYESSISRVSIGWKTNSGKYVTWNVQVGSSSVQTTKVGQSSGAASGTLNFDFANLSGTVSIYSSGPTGGYGITSLSITEGSGPVVNPDVVLDKTNKPFTSTSNSNTSEEDVTLSGIKYHNYGGYVYSSNYLSFNRSINGYLYNVTAFSKNISKIVVNYNSGGSSYFKMYEGATAGAETTTITPDSSGTGNITYTFNDSKQFFKFKLDTTGTYCNINSISIYLGSDPVVKVVDTVSIAQPGSLYVGKSLQLSATVTYLSGVPSDNSVTWRVSSGDGATVTSGGLVTGVSTTTTTIEAKSVEKNSGGQQVTATVTITPLANPIVSVAWNTTNAKKSYNVGDPLDISNIIATGTNAAGDNDVVLTLTESNFSGFDSSTAVNSQTITISYPNEVTPSSPFTTTYTITILAVPNIHLVNTDFAANYTDTSLTSDDGTEWTLSSIGNYSSTIQIKSGASYGMYNNTEMGQRISKVAVKVAKGGIYLGFSANELDFNGSATESRFFDTEDGDAVYTVTGDFQFMRFTPSGSTQLNYIKIWYDPFEPAVSLNNSSFEIDEGEAGSISVTATAQHFTNNSGVVFTAASGDQSVLLDANISVSGATVTIVKANVNPGTVTVSVTGTYAAASESATASFTITCTAAARNLVSIAITTSSSDTEFETGSIFTITDLVVTGTFDAAPLSENVTSTCSFKLWDGSSETALTPGSTTLSSAGNYTVRITHSPAEQVLTYSISVVTSSTLTLTPNLNGESFAYGDTKTPSININLNANLESTFDMETYGLSRQDDNMQMNPSKGTYIKNTTAVPGKIVRIEMDWTANNPGTNATPTIYFSDSYMPSRPVSGGTKATAGTSNSVSAVGNNSYFYFDGTTLNGWTQLVELRIIYVENDTGAAKNFADKYLLMNTYDQGGSHGSTGGDKTCLTQYDVASTAYGKLTPEQKTEFAKLSAAVTRMEDWATANGYTFNAASGTFTQNSQASMINFAEDATNVTAIIVIISIASLTAIGGYFFLRKRREQN